MTFKSPTTALNEILLRAALRAERINHHELLDGENRQHAKQNDNSVTQYRHRVPEIQTVSAEHGSDNRPQQHA